MGAYQKANLGTGSLAVGTKSSPVDLVTEVDKYSEDYLVKAIRAVYPAHGLLAEESGKHSDLADYLWVIDPLDGTTNYAQGLPIFTISVALQYQGATVLGMVYAPVLDQMYTAIRGRGAHLNDRPLHVSAKDDLSISVLATGFPYDRASHPDNNLNYFNRFTPLVRGIRRMGSAAYDLANVAAGTLDGYWELNLAPWDVAAGALLVEEAGGQVVYLSEKRGVSLVAGSAAMCRQMLNQIRAVDTGE